MAELGTPDEEWEDIVKRTKRGEFTSAEEIRQVASYQYETMGMTGINAKNYWIKKMAKEAMEEENK